MSTVLYRAYRDGVSCVANTPRAAAQGFFNQTTKRKCNVVAGVIEGNMFVSRAFIGTKPETKFATSWRDITKKTVDTLPDVANENDIVKT